MDGIGQGLCKNSDGQILRFRDLFDCRALFEIRQYNRLRRRSSSLLRLHSSAALSSKGLMSTITEKTYYQYDVEYEQDVNPPFILLVLDVVLIVMSTCLTWHL